jgi:hypothetical protein
MPWSKRGPDERSDIRGMVPGVAGMLVAFKLLLLVLGYNRRIVVASTNVIGIACAAIEALGRCHGLPQGWALFGCDPARPTDTLLRTEFCAC